MNSSDLKKCFKSLQLRQIISDAGPTLITERLVLTVQVLYCKDRLVED